MFKKFKTTLKWLSLPLVAGVIGLQGLSLAAAGEIKSILVFGDSNTWGWAPKAGDGYPTGRYADDTRWAGVVQSELGSDYKIVVDGLVGRTSNISGEDGPHILSDHVNGEFELPASVVKHGPFEMVVIMLGTNDVQAGRLTDATKVASSVFNLARKTTNMDNAHFSTYASPSVMVVTPPSLGDTSKTALHGLFGPGVPTSKNFSSAFKAEARKTENMGILTLDAGEFIQTDGPDGIHLSAASHKKLGIAVAAALKKGMMK